MTKWHGRFHMLNQSMQLTTLTNLKNKERKIISIGAEKIAFDKKYIPGKHSQQTKHRGKHPHSETGVNEKPADHITLTATAVGALSLRPGDTRQKRPLSPPLRYTVLEVPAGAAQVTTEIMKLLCHSGNNEQV